MFGEYAIILLDVEINSPYFFYFFTHQYGISLHSPQKIIKGGIVSSQNGWIKTEGEKEIDQKGCFWSQTTL